MDNVFKYGILVWDFLGKAFEYLMYFSIFMIFFLMICLGDIDSQTTRMLPWAKDPSLVLHIATLFFVSIISYKKEHLSGTNLIVLLLAFFGFIFGYYGVPEFLHLK